MRGRFLTAALLLGALVVVLVGGAAPAFGDERTAVSSGSTALRSRSLLRGDGEDAGGDAGGDVAGDDAGDDAGDAGGDGAAAGGEEGATDGEAAPAKSDGKHPMDKLVKHMMSGGATKDFKGDHFHVALGNANEFHSEDYDDTGNPGEEAVKKEFEVGQKRAQEQSGKLQLEERGKMQSMETRSMQSEEGAKHLAEKVQTQTEQETKRATLDARQSSEAMQKRLDLVTRQAQRAKDDAERSKEALSLKGELATEKMKLQGELLQKKNAAEVQKIIREATEKRDEAKHKDALEKQSKEHAAKMEARKAERKRKVWQEGRTKHWRKLSEKSQKRNAQVQEQQQKAAARRQERRRKWLRRNTYARWKSCRSQRVYFHQTNRWFTCPSGSLLTGMYRGNRHYLNYIYYFHCCTPRRPDNTYLSATSCMTANWVRSFDRKGLSRCPHRYYINGLYKSSCNLIYCLEYARCCRINGSRGPKHCNWRNSWGRSFDRRGWSVLSGHRFMAGIYRSGNHYLYNIEYPLQCLAYAY